MLMLITYDISLEDAEGQARLCVETYAIRRRGWPGSPQPPLGGCVLKRQYGQCLVPHAVPAAFRRLCVETKPSAGIKKSLSTSRL